MMTAGMLLFTKIAASGSAIVYVVVPGVLTAAGIGMSIVPSTIAATQGAKQGQQGLASGLVNTSRQVGGGLGIAVLITLATSLTSHLIGRGHGVLQALTDGFRLGYFIAAGLCAAAAVVTFTLVAKPATAERAPRRRGRVPAIVLAVGRGDRRLRRARVRRGRLPRRAARLTTRPAVPTAMSPSPSLKPADHPHHDPDQHRQARARLHPHRELLRPEPPADDRPERPADPRQPPPAGLVQARAGRRRGRQPQPPALRRQAGAHLVAGHDHHDGRHRDR